MRSFASTWKGTEISDRDCGEETMQATTQGKNWKKFYDSARHNDVLDEKTTLMLHLASAMALGCYP